MSAIATRIMRTTQCRIRKHWRNICQYAHRQRQFVRCYHVSYPVRSAASSAEAHLTEATAVDDSIEYERLASQVLPRTSDINGLLLAYERILHQSSATQRHTDERHALLIALFARLRTLIQQTTKELENFQTFASVTSPLPQYKLDHYLRLITRLDDWQSAARLRLVVRGISLYAKELAHEDLMKLFSDITTILPVWSTGSAAVVTQKSLAQALSTSSVTDDFSSPLLSSSSSWSSVLATPIIHHFANNNTDRLSSVEFHAFNLQRSHIKHRIYIPSYNGIHHFPVLLQRALHALLEAVSTTLPVITTKTRSHLLQYIRGFSILKQHDIHHIAIPRALTIIIPLFVQTSSPASFADEDLMRLFILMVDLYQIKFQEHKKSKVNDIITGAGPADEQALIQGRDRLSASSILTTRPAMESADMSSVLDLLRWMNRDDLFATLSMQQISDGISAAAALSPTSDIVHRHSFNAIVSQMSRRAAQLMTIQPDLIAPITLGLSTMAFAHRHWFDSLSTYLTERDVIERLTCQARVDILHAYAHLGCDTNNDECVRTLTMLITSIAKSVTNVSTDDFQQLQPFHRLVLITTLWSVHALHLDTALPISGAGRSYHCHNAAVAEVTPSVRALLNLFPARLRFVSFQHINLPMFLQSVAAFQLSFGPSEWKKDSKSSDSAKSRSSSKKVRRAMKMQNLLQSVYQLCGVTTTRPMETSDIITECAYNYYPDTSTTDCPTLQQLLRAEGALDKLEFAANKEIVTKLPHPLFDLHDDFILATSDSVIVEERVVQNAIRKVLFVC